MLINLGLYSTVILKLRKDTCPSNEGMIFFRIASLTADELSVAPSNWPNALNEISASNERQARSSLLKVLKEVNESEWKTTIEEDEELLNNISESTSPMSEDECRLKTSVEYRLTQKRIAEAHINQLLS